MLSRRGPTTYRFDLFLAGKMWGEPWGMQRRSSLREIDEVKRSDRLRAWRGQGYHGGNQDCRLGEKVSEFSFSTLLGSRRSGEHILQSLRTRVKIIRKYGRNIGADQGCQMP